MDTYVRVMLAMLVMFWVGPDHSRLPLCVGRIGTV